MRKYTVAQYQKYWMARCPECGWKGLTCDCWGFGPIADTGDYDDGYCPRCGGTVGADDEEPRRRLLWAFRWLTNYPERKRRAELETIARAIEKSENYQP